MKENELKIKTIVPIDSFWAYLNSPRWQDMRLRCSIESQLSNYGKKSNYKKFAKRIKKAVKYLPEGIEVVVREEMKGGAE